MPPDLTPGLNVKISEFNELTILTGNENLIVEKEKYEVRTNFNKLVKLPISLVAISNMEKDDVTVDGPSTVIGGVPTNFIITNYNTDTDYVIDPVCGTAVIIVDDIIEYTAPLINDTCGFTINGKLIEVDIVNITIARPVILSPANNSTGLGPDVNYTSSPFEAIGGLDTHFSSDWEIATNIEFTTGRQSITNSTTDKTTRSIVGLLENTDYYARVRYRSVNNRISDWSLPVKITTKVSYLPSVVVYTGTLVGLPTDININLMNMSSMAMSNDGNRVIIGFGDGATTIDFIDGCGAALIYVKNNGVWEIEQLIYASNKYFYDYFGYKVDINYDGSMVLVSAIWGDKTGVIDDIGVIYEFTRTGSVWTETAQVTLNTPVYADQFGFLLKLSKDGTRFVASKFNVMDFTTATYVFVKSGASWIQETEIDLGLTRWTGNPMIPSSLDMDYTGTRIIIGAVDEETILDNTRVGAVWVYKRSGTVWSQETKLYSSDGRHTDAFGSALSISDNGDIIVVSNPVRDEFGLVNTTRLLNDAGAVYIFNRTIATWNQTTKLIVTDAPVIFAPGGFLASDGVADNDYFGWAVNISGDGHRILVGARMARNFSADVSSAGGVYIYDKVGVSWNKVGLIRQNPKILDHHFSRDIDSNLDGTSLLVRDNSYFGIY